MLVYNNPRVPFGTNIVVTKVTLSYCVIYNYFRYATVNTMFVDRESAVKKRFTVIFMR